MGQDAWAHPALLRAELNELPPTRPPLRAASAGPAAMGPSACEVGGYRQSTYDPNLN